jgi:soluble lytic murein transglycosylase-like protein
VPPGAGDGLMQVEPGTRQAYAGKFQEKMGHAYDHNDPKDQVAMAGVILADKGGDATNMLQKYNGGDHWAPGATDS